MLCGLCARDREPAAEDEERHARDAQLARELLVLANRASVASPLENLARFGLGDAHVGGQLHERLDLADRGALAEVAAHQTLFQRRLHAALLAEMKQAMR